MLQDTSLDFKLVQRICLLQQALDQAMDSLAELQQRVEEHQMLESHLAQTEEYSNVQQKIILNLQQKLTAKTQWQRQVLERVVGQVKALVDSQQIELERLRARVHQSQAEVQTYLVRLKDDFQADPQHALAPLDIEGTSEVMLARNLTVSLCSQLQSARQHIHELDRTLTRQQITFAQLQAQVRTLGHAEARGSEPPAESLGRADCACEAADLAALEDPAALQAVVEAQHQKIVELSSELNKQFQEQTQLKQRCQILAAERDCYQQQTADLHQENERLRAQLAQHQSEQSKGKTSIPQWRAQSQEPNPLFRFKPDH
jgi:hypothetical protein